MPAPSVGLLRGMAEGQALSIADSFLPNRLNQDKSGAFVIESAGLSQFWGKFFAAKSNDYKIYAEAIIYI